MESPDHNGWQQLLNAQSQYITNLQRMLKSSSHPQLPENNWIDDSPKSIHGTVSGGDEGAGGSAIRHATGTPPMPAPTSQLLGSESILSQAPRIPQTHSEAIQPSPRADEVASEVLKLRLLKSQHEELRVQLDRASANLRRLPPQALFQLRMYLERQLRLRDGVQEVLLILIECLCQICNIEFRQGKTQEELLSAVRRLLRDPHHFASKLCEIQLGLYSARGRENQAKGLALFLLKGPNYKRVREKEVNDCYDALHGWLHALYLFNQVSAKVEPISEELARQEDLLSDLATQERIAAAKGGTTMQRPRVSAPGAQRAPTSAMRQSPLLKGTAISGGSGVSGRSRPAAGSGSPGQTAGGLRRSPSNGSIGRSQSPGLDSRSPSPPVPSYRGPAPRSPIPAASGRGTATAGSTTSNSGNIASRQAILNRTQSEKTLGRSPRNTRASRSPSPGNTRPPVERQSSAGNPAMFDSRSMASRPEVRTTRGLSPSQSEKSLRGPIAQSQMSKGTVGKRGPVPQGTAPGPSAPRPGLGSVAAAWTGPTNRSSDPMRPARAQPGYARYTGELRPERTMPPTVGRTSTASNNIVDQSPRSEASEGDADPSDFGPNRRRLPAKQYAALVRSAQQVERMRTR